MIRAREIAGRFREAKSGAKSRILGGMNTIKVNSGRMKRVDLTAEAVGRVMSKVSEMCPDAEPAQLEELEAMVFAVAKRGPGYPVV